ncbi:MAG: hypothetical protein ABIQ95_05310 [Bdellovibrionia bacterium]
MKALIKTLSVASFICAISAAAVSANDEILTLPDTLYCKGVQSLKGEKDFCNLKDYASIKLSQLNSRTPVLGEDEDQGTLELDKSDHKVILDFGVGAHGGDQYSTYTFSKKGMAELALGKAVQISGLYEDGYDWVDGYHVRALILLQCHK